MRDTAGWFQHVMTDKDGLATISVDLPANVTEWLITAVAADKLGRVGEEKGQFRTRADIAVEVLAPQFVRTGDTAILSVQSVNHLERSVPVTTEIEITEPGSPTSGALGESFTLEKKGEHLQSLQFSATGGSGAAEVNVAVKTEDDLLVAGNEAFELPLKPAAMPQMFSGVPEDGRFLTSIPETATVRSLKVDVLSGLFGAALNSAAVLVSYPYGCTEQLVHSTVPNLVLMDLVKKAGISPGRLGPLAKILLQAEKNAAVGISNIMKNQKTDGGFGAWRSSSETSLAVTLTALYALNIAKDLKIDGAESALNRGVAWLDTKIQAKGRKEHRAFSPYELSRFAEIAAYAQPWDEQIAFVKSLTQTSTPSPMHLVYGLRIFKAYQQQGWNRFNQEFKESKARATLVGKLQKSLEPLESLAETQLLEKDPQFFEQLGFGYGLPSIVSAVLGVLDDEKALASDLKKRLGRILLQGMKNGYWTSTFDTAQVIFNTRGLLAKEAAAAAHETAARSLAVVLQNGRVLGSLARIPGGFSGFFLSPGESGDLADIRITGLLPNEVAYTHVAADVPFAAVKPAVDGIAVERKLFLVTPTGHEEFKADTPLRKGDTVVSEIIVKRGRMSEKGALQSRFVVVEDGVPSQAQTIDSDESLLVDAKLKPDTANYWSLIKETQRYPDKTIRVAEVAPGGEIKLYQVWQVTFSGAASLPPASAFDMYDESVRGNTGSDHLQVE